MMNTWSWASVHTPVIAPVTHFLGMGLGQVGSTSYFGGLTWDFNGREQDIASTIANIVALKIVFRLISLFLCRIYLPSPSMLTGCVSHEGLQL
jgi:hypothetical protein